MKNKILLCFIVISLMFCITGCGNKENNTGIIENTEGKLIINGYDLTLDAEGSFYKINFKYPSKATISNPVTSLVIDYPKKNSKESLFKVAMGYMYGSSIDDSMKGFTKVETKTINDIEWTIYKDQNGEKVPVTQKVILPKIEGAIITAEGANSVNIKANIVQAVEVATGLATHKIQVFTMKT